MIQYEGEYYFTLCQKDKRCFHNKPYKYSPARIIFCQNIFDEGAVDQEFGTFKYFESSGSANRDTVVHCANLKQGEYFMYVEMDWETDLAENEFVVSSYGVEECIFLCDDAHDHT